MFVQKVYVKKLTRYKLRKRRNSHMLSCWQFIQSSFIDRHFSYGVFYIILQQAFVALSIFGLASAAQRLLKPLHAVAWLFGFVVLSILPYTPGILAQRPFQLWFMHSCLML